MLYRLAVETGLRSAELRSLTRSSFNLAREEPTVTIAAAYAKNRRQDTLPLKPETANALARHFAGKMPASPAFTMAKRDQIIDMMTADLADARTGWIAAGGVHPKTAQRLARHSTITLTMDRYTHLRREDLTGALDSLPNLASVPQAVIATGTDPAAISLAPSLSPHGDFSRPDATGCAQLTSTYEDSLREDDVAKTTGFSGVSTSECNPGGGSRTRTGISAQRILSP